MNPPLKGGRKYDEVLSKYVKKNYEEGKADFVLCLYVFRYGRLEKNGKQAQINMQSLDVSLILSRNYVITFLTN
jgi:hypothetical protein